MAESEQNNRYTGLSQLSGNRYSGGKYTSKQNFVSIKKHYERECTVRIERIPTKIIGERIVVEDIENVTGMNTVLAVVQSDLTSYDVTFDCKENAFKLLRGIDIASNEYECSMMFSDITVVSVIKLPSYIKDEDIKNKIESKGVKVVSPVYRRAIPGTQVADGTRFMKCKFPPGMISLPWTMPFKIGSEVKYFRVVHNNQTKVCSECLSPEHMRRECPYIDCHGCGSVGHRMRNCQAQKCNFCHKLPLKCVCNPVERIVRERNEKNCRDCGELNCKCKCSDCGNLGCTCTVSSEDDTEVIITGNQRANIEEREEIIVEKTNDKSNDIDNIEIMDGEIVEENDTLLKSAVSKNDNVAFTNRVISAKNNENKKTDDSEVNTMEVEVEVHREQTETHEKLKRKREKSRDSNTDSIDRTEEGEHEIEIEMKENKALGTDRELIDGKKIKRNIMNVSSCEDINMEGEENDENVRIEDEITGTSVDDILIITEGAQDNKESSVCSDNDVENLSNEGTFVSAKEARKIKKKQRKIERRQKLKITPNLDGKGVRHVIDKVDDESSKL